MKRFIKKIIKKSDPVRLAVLTGLLFLSFSTQAAVTVTTATGGTNITADNAANASSPAYVTLGNIVIAEPSNDKQAFSANQTNVTFTLNAPSGWQFNTSASITASFTAAMDLTSASVTSKTTSAITITFSTGSGSSVDQLTISGVEMQSTEGGDINASGNIMRGGTANIGGCGNGTHLGSLSQAVGAMSQLVVTLPGENFNDASTAAASGNSGNVTSKKAGTAFNIDLTATDQFFNIVTTYSGSKTISYSGPGSGLTAPTYTTAVSFTNGQAVTTLATTLTKAETTTITASDGTISGPASSDFLIKNGSMTGFIVEASAGGSIGTQIAGITFSIKITACDANNNIVIGFNAGNKTVDITSSGTLTAGGGTTAAFISGVLTTSVTISPGATNVTITATRTTGGAQYGISNAFTVNNPTPGLSSISPTCGIAGNAGFTLTVNGTDFSSGSVVNLNGSARTTTYISTTQITAAITDADLASAGTYSITVVNPTPTGGASSSAVLTLISTSDAGSNEIGPTTCGSTQVTLSGNSPSGGTGAWTVVTGTGGSFGSPSSSVSTFNGTAAIAYTLRWTISSGTCSSSSDVHVTFNQNPTTASAGTDQTGSATCGLTQATLAGNTPAIGTGAWSIVSGTGGSFGNSASATSTFNGTAGNSYTLRWTIANSPCTSSTSNVNVTFNKNPTAANAGSDQTNSSTCGLTQVTLAGNSATIGTGAWSIVSGTGGSFGNSSSPTSTFNGTAGNTYTLKWTISNSPCTATTSNVTVTLNQKPSASVSSLSPFCNGASVVLSAGVSGGSSPYSYAWSGPHGTIAPVANPSITTISSADAGTYSITVTDSKGCTITSSTVKTVATLTNPSSAVTGSYVVCAGTHGATFTATPIPGATSYLWSSGYNNSSTNPIAITSGQGTNSITINVAAGFTFGYVVVYGVNQCGTDTFGRSFQFRSNPGTPSLISGPTSVCANGSATYSIVPNPNYEYSYTWAVPTGMSIVSGLHSNTVNATTNSSWTSGTLSIISSNTCGNGTSRLLTVKSKPDALGGITGPAVVCASSTAAYSIPITANATSYIWSMPSGMSITSGLNTNSIKVSTTSGWVSGSLSVIASNGCGTTAAKTLVMKSVVAVPGVITVTGGTTKVCHGDIRTFSISPVAGANSYSWTVPSKVSIISRNDTSMQISFNNDFTTGNLCVTANNVCGSSASKCIALSLNTAPTPGAITMTGGNLKVCPGESRSYSINPVATASSYSWSIPSTTAGININGSGTSLTGVATSIQLNFTSTFTASSVVLSVVASNSCYSSDAKTITINRNSPTAPGGMVGPSSACPYTLGFVFSIPLVTNATSYLWTAPAGSLIHNQGTNSIIIDFGATVGTISVATVNTCGISAAKTKNLKSHCSYSESGIAKTEQPEDMFENNEELVKKTEGESDLQSNEEYHITFTFDAARAGVYIYRIYDASDNALLTGKIQAIEGVNRAQVVVSSFPKKVLILNIQDGTSPSQIGLAMQ